jgi:hypothetical protein
MSRRSAGLWASKVQIDPAEVAPGRQPLRCRQDALWVRARHLQVHVGVGGGRGVRGRH